MPIARYRPNLPALYPDTSTLLYACSDQALMAALDRIGREANLCLSFVHLLELADGRNPVADFAKMEELNFVWMLQLEEIERQELLSHLIGQRQAFPFARRLSDSLSSLDAATKSELDRSKSPLGSLLIELASHEHSASRQSFRNESVRVSRRFWWDRREVPANAAEILDSQMHKLMVEETRRHIGDASLIASRSGIWLCPDRTRLPRDIEELRALPSWFCSVSVGRAMALLAGAKNGHERFFSPEKRQGDLHDLHHVAIGAAYCEAFVCDKRTARLVTEPRRQLGRAVPIVLEGDRASWPSRLVASVGLKPTNEGCDRRAPAEEPAP